MGADTKSEIISEAKPETIQTMMTEIRKNAGGKWNDKLGSTIAKMISNHEYPPAGQPGFESYDALIDDAIRVQGGGKEAKRVGNEREGLAAAHIGGAVAQIEGKDRREFLMEDGKKTHHYVDLDVASDDVWGIVGGGAKALDASHFRVTCVNLKKISLQQDKKAMVFFDNDPPTDLVNLAQQIVGRENVRNLRTGGLFPLAPTEEGPAIDAGFEDMD